MNIESISGDSIINVCLDTLKKNKQSLIFVSTKRNAEAQSERIAKHIMLDEDLKESLHILEKKILNVLSSPTKQCKRLAHCVSNGSAFHHSGLHPKQRELIEENFKKGIIKFISATPTLAFGLNLPAFRVIIRDLKRFGKNGIDFIPVLEYHQMIGRAGRPDFNETHGEAITFANSQKEFNNIKKNFILASPEIIYSKLAVEPVFRTYVLSLIVSGVCNTSYKLEEFFSKSFYALQYGDSNKIKSLITKTLTQLKEWNFIESNNTGKSFADDFISANSATLKENNNHINIRPTLLGRRISELYLDPYTANHLINSLKKINSQEFEYLAILQVFTNTLEMRPLLTIRKSDQEFIQEILISYRLVNEKPTFYDIDYEDFEKSLKTANFLFHWIEEYDEEFLLETFNIRPGEIKAKLDIVDWLIFSSEEISRILNFKNCFALLKKLRIRLKYGVKEELLGLMSLKNIGRVRARKLYNNRITNLKSIKQVDFEFLKKLIGEKTALNIKEQVGENLDSNSLKNLKLDSFS